MKPKIKPRNPFVVLAKFRKAGSHEKPEKSLRRQENQALAKAAKQSPESWHKRIQLNVFLPRLGLTGVTIPSLPCAYR